MSITIDLPPEVEKGLFALAKARGVSLPVYLSHLLVEKVALSTPHSPSVLAQMWRDAAKGLPATQPLSDAAISRDAIYHDRG